MVDDSPYSVGAFVAMPADVTRHLVGTGFWSRLSHVPGREVCVPEDFLGVNVAGSPDGGVQDFVFDRLDELGVGQVRVDAGYDAPHNFQQDFIQELMSRGYGVLLRLHQPAAAAASMCVDRQARVAWRAHVEWARESFDLERLEGLELGTTPNRRRWSGYRYRSFFIAWRLACDVLSGEGVRLVGPGVSDFEPLHSICMLRGLGALGCVPEVHGVNLFSERTRIPEAWDHRVAGRFLGDRLRLNLVKKFRVFGAIGEQFGLSETWCTHACWNAERVAQWSDDVEGDRADYLRRYLFMAAASGSVQRVYWGPLVGFPDGLIYEGDRRFGPDEERVARYRLSPGRVEDMRLTPSFSMLKEMQGLLSGAGLSLGVDEGEGRVRALVKRDGEMLVVEYGF